MKRPNTIQFFLFLVHTYLMHHKLQKHKYFTQRHSLLYTYNYALWLKMCYPTSWSQPHSCLPVNCLQ